MVGGRRTLAPGFDAGVTIDMAFHLSSYFATNVIVIPLKHPHTHARTHTQTHTHAHTHTYTHKQK